MGIEPDAVVTTPLRRAVETARPIAAMLDVPLIRTGCCEPGFDEAAFAAVIDRHGEARSLTLVGHEPDLSELVGYLTGAHVRAAQGRASRASTSRTSAPSRSELRWLLRPKQLRLIAPARVTA